MLISGESPNVVHPGKPAPPIDLIFFTEHFKPISAKSLQTNRDGVYPSDHKPIEAAFAWK